VIIGERLRALRLKKRMSQGDVEKRSGLLRSYISRVEHGHTIPTVENLGKFGYALEVPVYQLFYDGSEKPPDRLFNKRSLEARRPSIAARKDAQILNEFCRLFAQMSAADRWLIFHIGKRMASRSRAVNRMDSA